MGSQDLPPLGPSLLAGIPSPIQPPFRAQPPHWHIASGGLRPLQMISELDTGRCANEEAKPKGVAQGGVPVRRLSPEGGGHEVVCQRGG